MKWLCKIIGHKVLENWDYPFPDGILCYCHMCDKCGYYDKDNIIIWK